MIRLFFIILTFFCIGCSPNFSGAHIHYKEYPSSPLFLKSLSLKVNNESIAPSPKMISAYNSSLNETTIHKDCEVVVSIRKTIQTETKSIWYLGAALMIPFWPAMPMKVSLRLESTVEITCSEFLTHRLDFIEEEELDLFWYGALRTYEIENKLEWLHEKMIKRLEIALQYEIPVDAGCASDF